MKFLLNAIAPPILVSALATSVVAQSAGDDHAAGEALFVQHAVSATLSDGTLTLNDIDKHMIAFSDRPFRATMAFPTEGLIEIWNKGQDSFSDDPPNAVLMG
ncbi:hypothetical protein [uncultured Ruegeria sp.]|nr:hypothetical protein [uncultured Ruegeria sp.]